MNLTEVSQNRDGNVKGIFSVWPAFANDVTIVDETMTKLCIANKLADELVRIGPETPFKRPESTTYISDASARTELGTWLHKEKLYPGKVWQNRAALKNWASSPQINSQPSIQEVTKIVGLLTGHYF